MNLVYRRRQLDSRLERLLAWLLPASRSYAALVGRIDLVHTEAIEILSPKS